MRVLEMDLIVNTFKSWIGIFSILLTRMCKILKWNTWKYVLSSFSISCSPSYSLCPDNLGKMSIFFAMLKRLIPAVLWGRIRILDDARQCIFPVCLVCRELMHLHGSTLSGQKGTVGYKLVPWSYRLIKRQCGSFSRSTAILWRSAKRSI